MRTLDPVLAADTRQRFRRWRQHDAEATSPARRRGRRAQTDCDQSAVDRAVAQLRDRAYEEGVALAIAGAPRPTLGDIGRPYLAAARLGYATGLDRARAHEHAVEAAAGERRAG